MREFPSRLRLNESARLLATPNRTVLDICTACGYSTLSVFYAAFEKFYHCPPGRLRKQ